MIRSIRVQRLWEYEKDQISYFHPRACVMCGTQENDPKHFFMTLQPITGSDVFHHVLWAMSDDRCETWTKPKEIPEFGWKPFFDDVFEGVCDVVPGFHAKTGVLLAIGHSVYYQNNHLLDTMGDWKTDNVGYQRRVRRFPVYTIRRPDGTWATRQSLDSEYFQDCSIHTCGCSQRIDLDNGEILLPISYGLWTEKARKVCTTRCSFDGESLRIIEKSRDFVLPVGRGLLEPSLVRYQDRCFITIRAEDGHGYGAVSDDGMNWEPMRPWQWEGGEPLTMSTTQQHYLVHGDLLYLVYNRKSDCNTQVFRWRSPLYMAQVDPGSLALIRDTEQLVFPILGDGNAPKPRIPGMGNFHTCRISATRSMVTVGEECSYDNWRGNTLVARIV